MMSFIASVRSGLRGRKWTFESERVRKNLKYVVWLFTQASITRPDWSPLNVCVQRTRLLAHDDQGQQPLLLSFVYKSTVVPMLWKTPARRGNSVIFPSYFGSLSHPLLPDILLSFP
jgi:hypothetical protein